MNQALQLSEAGANLIKSFEQCAAREADGTFRPYYCPAGVLTLGWGHTNAQGAPFQQDDRWTQSRCDAVLLDDMVAVGAEVKAMVQVQLTQYQFDALVSFAYNCGSGNLRSSTLLKLINNNDFEAAVHEFSKWNRCNGAVLEGLVRRRAAEAMMFEGVSPVPNTASGVHAAPRLVDSPAH